MLPKSRHWLSMKIVHGWGSTENPKKLLIDWVAQSPGMLINGGFTREGGGPTCHAANSGSTKLENENIR